VPYAVVKYFADDFGDQSTVLSRNPIIAVEDWKLEVREIGNRKLETGTSKCNKPTALFMHFPPLAARPWTANTADSLGTYPLLCFQ
jgi:hypothetical protein